MVLWELAFEGRHHLILSKFFRCYVVKEQEPGWFFFANWDPLLTLVMGLPSFNSRWKTRYFFVSGEGWEYPPGEVPEVKFNRGWASVISPMGRSFILVVVRILLFSRLAFYSSLILFSFPPFFSYQGE